MIHVQLPGDESRSRPATGWRREAAPPGDDAARDWQRSAAIGLILLQAIEIALLLQKKSPALIAAAVGLLGWLAGRRGYFWDFSMSRWSSGAAALLLVWYYSFPQELGFHGYIGSELAFVLACFCLAVQLLTLFQVRFQHRLPYWFLLLSGLGLIIGADARVDAWQRDRMIWLVLAYLLLWGTFAGALRTRQVVSQTSAPAGGNLVLLLTLILAALTTWGTSTFLRGHQEELERWLTNYLIETDLALQRQGFSGTGGIRDISQTRMDNQNAISLRISSPVRPGYLRGQAFSRFNSDRWYNPHPVQEFIPAPRLWDGDSRAEPRRAYHLSPMPLDQSQTMVIWNSESRVNRYLFLPRQTAAIITTAPSLSIQSPEIILNAGEEGVGAYQVILDPSLRSQDQDSLNEDSTLPRDLPPVVSERAKELFTPLRGDGERIQAVQAYFRGNYRYNLNANVPPDRDKLEFFLTEGREGNCEFFATATALLLRQAGIPARYVTGFVVSDQNAVDNLWLARHKDAHAWVEAYDRDRRDWVIVESTPADGVPTPHEIPRWQQWNEAAQQIWSLAVDYVQSGHVWGWLLRNWSRVPAVLLVLWLLRYLWRLRRRRQEVRAQSIPLYSTAAGLVDERMALDRRLARCGWRRAPGETLLRFAQRIESQRTLSTAAELAEWYRRYSDLRFRSRPITPEEIQRLRLERRHLARNTKRTP